ncbi:uncharacterized protein LOC101746073 [Bombyx mori]|uniref:Chitin-binding type-2 domain-containing protein n=1 Tax=Bombyx mori TaxID=7091 RepID=A0A8R2GAW5_BOMMO|nr:uncharacterized protein LOC101746073 [Bombyx mori]
MWVWLFLVVAALSRSDGAGAGAARLVCYTESARPQGFAECTHLVYAGDARGDKLDTLLKEYRKSNPRLKIVVRVADDDKDLRAILKLKNVQGLEIHNTHRSLNRTKVLESVEEARSAITSSGGGPLFLALPAHPELLAKYYDLRSLVKKVDLLMVQTHALGLVKKMTYHPSRLSGLWDMMNTDSVVDLVVGLGVPASKIVISLPATVRQFTLVNETLSTPGSPAEEDEPKEVDQAELCRQLQKGRWTLERDQDLSAPYAFKNKIWMSFEDASSVDVKGKYARVRGLAGLALHRADRDPETPCGPTLKASLSKVLNQQSRAPRAVVLRSLENEILSAPGHRAIEALQVSPYRITQVVDSDGVIHSIREDTRTEFSCSRQGYFVHPRSCARFYRCVKFDQLSPEYTVFEFDCPAGLAFDSRYEVCVWPGSLPHSQACPGSSEIAPVPQTRFVCPEHEGYYADPENCRWFFACLDHGKAPLTAYEFRCPFGLGFDADKLKCDWPWLVPACGNIARYEAEAHGFSAAILTGAAGFQGQTADAVNIAAHQSLISGASLNNLVGIQDGFLTKADALDSNFIASQEYAAAKAASDSSYQTGDSATQNKNGLLYATGDASIGNSVNVGLVNPSTYTDEGKYTSGSLILDDYRLPTKAKSVNRAQSFGAKYQQGATALNAAQTGFTNQEGYSTSFTAGKSSTYQGGAYESGAYVHDPSGDYAEPYRHVGSPVAPYVHDDSAYLDVTQYSTSSVDGKNSQSGYKGTYEETINTRTSNEADLSGQYVHDNSGDYVQSSGKYNSGGSANAGYEAGFYGTGTGYNVDYSKIGGKYKVDHSGSYNADYSGLYDNENSGKYVAGIYRADGQVGDSPGAKASSVYHGSYSQANAGNYLSDSRARTGASHTLTAGAVNVGLVGKTTLVDAIYNDQSNYQGINAQNSFAHQTLHPNHILQVSQPAVSINHVGTDGNNLDGYSFVTNPTSSGVPTTTTPIEVTTSLPIVSTYKTTFIPEPPRTSIKQIFGYSQPAVTYVQPTVIPLKQVASGFQINEHNQGFTYQNVNAQQASGTRNSGSIKSSSGYDYSKPSIKFEDGLSFTTASPEAVSVSQSEGFGNSQQTVHNIESVGFEYSTARPVSEEPFKKLIAYTTGAPVAAFPSTTYRPLSFSHKTLHKVEADKFVPSVETNIEYQQPQIVQYSTVQPTIAVQPVVSTYQPQVYSHQTLHKVDTDRLNVYSQKSSSNTYSDNTNTFNYEQPSIHFGDVQYSTPAPVVSTYRPQSHSQQIIHRVEGYSVPVSSTPQPVAQITYKAPVTVFENPILKYTNKPSTSFSHQTIHKLESSQAYTPSINTGSVDYETVVYNAPKIVYTTPQPTLAVAPVVSTYQPQVSSQQTLHQVDHSQIHTYSDNSESGYNYDKPAIAFEDAKPIVTYSTPAPAVSTYRPQTYRHQLIQKVEPQEIVEVSSTPAPTIKYTIKQSDVTTYENPFLKYTPKATPVTFVRPTPTVFAQTYTPIVEQHQVNHVLSQPVRYETQNSFVQQNSRINSEGFSSGQPEIQRNIETSNKAQLYSDASLVSQQSFHLSSTNDEYQSDKDVVFVSTTPSTLVYENHYATYDTPKKVETYRTREYIPPNTEYQQHSISKISNPVTKQNTVYQEARDEYDYKPAEYAEQYDIQKTVSSIAQAQKNVESIHFSAFPGTKVTTNYKQATYDSPEIQVEYKAEEYLPPVVSTVAPVITTTYKPRTYSTISTTRDYLTPIVDNSYLPPSSTERSYVKSTTPEYNYAQSTTTYNAAEYLPPIETKQAEIVNFESYGFNKVDATGTNYNTYQDYSVPKGPAVKIQNASPIQRKQNIVVETAKSNLLGFGTVGPDAGLISPVTYTTAAPIAVSSTVRPIVRTQRPYKRIQSTTEYQAPEYLPPSEVESSELNFKHFEYNGAESASETINNNQYNEDSLVISTATPKRKQNIVVETAKSHLLGFGTVGPDAGLVSSVAYTTAAPTIVSSSDAYTVTPKAVTTAYAPIEQGLFEVTPSPVPVRRTKPKVAVVTKINDFNPLLVRKLGAVCSCQSPVLILKGKRPNSVEQNYDNYDNSHRGDIGDSQWQKSSRIQASIATATPIVTSTFNPIIVPDDSFYQDYQGYENQEVNVTPKKEVYTERFVSSTPIASTTEKYRTRSRVKAVTVAPTYKTVLLNQEVAPSASYTESEAVSGIDSQAFDRYGPGGWRSRDETLQGSVDCQRAGLFRHPKQCNKFYACRWDCTKQRFTLHVFNCPIQLSFDPSIGACNWPSQGPACQGDTLLTNAL